MFSSVSQQTDCLHAGSAAGGGDHHSATCCTGGQQYVLQNYVK